MAYTAGDRGLLRGDATFSALAATAIAVSWLGRGRELTGCPQHAAMAAMLAAPVVLLAWNGLANASYRAWRPWSVTAFRFMTFVTPVIARLSRVLLQLEPTPGLLGGAADAGRLLIGSRAFMLLFISIGLPLDLPLHLAVHTLCVLATEVLCDLCSQPFLDNSLMQGRFRTLHSWMPLGLGGILPPSTPPSTHNQCATALSFVRLSVGWLLPTFYAARGSYHAAQQERRRERAQQREEREQRQEQEQEQRLHRWELQQQRQKATERHGDHASPSSARGSHGGSDAGDVRGGLAISSGSAAAPAGPLGYEREPPVRLLPLSGSGVMATWVLEHVFLWDAPAGEAARTWFILAAFCYLVAIIISAVLHDA